MATVLDSRRLRRRTIARRALGLIGSVTFIALASVSCRPSANGPSEQPDILLLVIDTLRSDHVGPFDSPYRLTPNLDEIARDATVFRHTVAQGSNTITSSPSLLASVYPSEHGYTHYRVAVADEHVTLAEVLSEAGYETFAVSTNPHVTVRSGLAQGFETFLDHVTWTDTDADEVNALFLSWLDQRSSDRPWFAMLWYVDPHVPYEPSEDLVEKHVPAPLRSLVGPRTVRPGFADLSSDEMEVTRALYRGEVEQWDEAFGQLRQALESRGELEDDLLVVTSDHGESFWERLGPDGRPVVGHGISLYREETSVPLVVRFPFGAWSGVVEHRVRSIDIAPTIVDAAGISSSSTRPPFRGSSLVELAATGASPKRPAVSELITVSKQGVEAMRMTSVEHDETKLVVTQTYRRQRYDPPLVELLDGRDQRSDTELSIGADSDQPLLDEMRRWRAALRPIPPVPLSPHRRGQDLEQRLEALGYVD